VPDFANIAKLIFNLKNTLRLQSLPFKYRQAKQVDVAVM